MCRIRLCRGPCALRMLFWGFLPPICDMASLGPVVPFLSKALLGLTALYLFCGSTFSNRVCTPKVLFCTLKVNVVLSLICVRSQPLFSSLKDHHVRFFPLGLYTSTVALGSGTRVCRVSLPSMVTFAACFAGDLAMPSCVFSPDSFPLICVKPFSGCVCVCVCDT